MTAVAAAVAACNVRTGGPTGVGGLAGGGTAPSIVGTWSRTVVIQTADDVISSETVWLFGSDGACERRRTTTSVRAGFAETLVDPCRYTLAGGRVTIQFTATSGSVSFTAVVNGGRLFLDGVEFRRI